jgi:ATP-dependent Clp protease ATP-binding subunit ClpC
MFQKYTEKARRIIFFARYEASQYGSRFIEVGHLLLGLDRESFATLRQVSSAPEETLRQVLLGLCTRSGETIGTDVDMPLSEACKRVLTYADEEAGRMSHRTIGPEHILLGVLREHGPEAAALATLGVDLATVRQAYSSPQGLARSTVEKLLAQVPDDRLEAAARLLAGLASGYFSAAGSSSDGPFSYTFGTRPEAE